ncbi:SCO family protein [Puniceicoccales bacterium CK1056]|uniref:SCO family protein n=1 Tax=Oceanipulchritudo coccoides TaxID=2706888 RepID=A0A6B2M026_9BACT|nr:SCO family protein [Oceanipulchritudo coccoides]NDV61105.1 SCO family protein [Oceanipulchritudo coccoides]
MKILHRSSTCIPQALLCALLLAAPGITSGEIVREGDRSPTPSLISERNQPITLVGERQTLITFIFTRCAAMEFCPRMAKQFEDVQEAIQEKGYTGLRLLSISLDPEFDRPELLKEYAKAVGADPATWNFATADTATIDSLTRDFRVHRNKDGGILNHTLCTALISPDGTIKRIWRGNAWTTEEVLEAVGIE